MIDNLRPGRTLFLLGTGTGLAPFLSIIRDPDAYDKFDRIVVAHGVRWIADLAYSDYLQDELPNDELIGELVREKLIYYPTVTREPFRHTGRLSAALASNAMTEALGLRRSTRRTTASCSAAARRCSRICARSSISAASKKATPASPATT